MAKKPKGHKPGCKCFACSYARGGSPRKRRKRRSRRSRRPTRNAGGGGIPLWLIAAAGIGGLLLLRKSAGAAAAAAPTTYPSAMPAPPVQQIVDNEDPQMDGVGVGLYGRY